MTNTERDLINASQEIGGIARMAAWASAGLAVAVEQTSRPVGDLTISQLLTILRAHSALINRVASAAIASWKGG